MPIATTDIHYRLSGGSGNTDPAAALGGAKSSTSITDATLNNLFDNVAGDEAASGDTEYRAIYIHNNHGSLTLQTPVIWVLTNTPSTSDTVDIGLGTSAVNGTEQTVANESTAPSGVTFSAPSSKGTGLSLGNLPAGQHKALWIRRTVSASATAFSNNFFELRVEGDTDA